MDGKHRWESSKKQKFYIVLLQISTQQAQPAGQKRGRHQSMDEGTRSRSCNSDVIYCSADFVFVKAHLPETSRPFTYRARARAVMCVCCVCVCTLVCSCRQVALQRAATTNIRETYVQSRARHRRPQRPLVPRAAGFHPPMSAELNAQRRAAWRRQVRALRASLPFLPQRPCHGTSPIAPASPSTRCRATVPPRRCSRNPARHTRHPGSRTA